MVFSLALFFIFIITGKSSLLVSLLTGILTSLLIVKEMMNVDTDNQNKIKHSLLINLGITTVNILNSILSIKEATGFIKYMPVIAVFTFFVVFKNSETGKKFYEIDISEFFKKFKNDDNETYTKDDVKLCNDKETGKPVYLLSKDRFLHMLILGPTGSGKTSQVIIPMISQDIANFDAGVTVLEPKGDLADKVYAMALRKNRKCYYFNPSFKSCPSFNPLQGEENDIVETIVTTFKMLNPDSPQYFQDVNEVLLRNAVMVVKRMCPVGHHPTLLQLNDILTNPGGQGQKMVTAFSTINSPNPLINKQNQDIVQYFMQEYYGERSKLYENASGIRTQLAKLISNLRLRKILNPTNGIGDIDFDACLSEGLVLAMTTSQGELGDLSKFLGYFLILNFQASVFRRPGNENTRRFHYFYIDEFQTYTNPSFANMLTQGRSYRVASHLGTQNRSLIGMGFGKTGKDFTELVSTNARNMIIFPGANKDDAKYYSEQFGEIIKTDIKKTRSAAKFNILYGFQKINYPTFSEQHSETTEARFSPSDIIYRPFGEVTYLIIKNNTVQVPAVGKIEYIDENENEILDQIILENTELLKNGIEVEPLRDASGLLKEGVNILDIVNKKSSIDQEIFLGSYGEELKIDKGNDLVIVDDKKDDKEEIIESFGEVKVPVKNEKPNINPENKSDINDDTDLIIEIDDDVDEDLKPDTSDDKLNTLDDIL